jgi:hypothetical protein
MLIRHAAGLLDLGSGKSQTGKLYPMGLGGRPRERVRS